MKTAILSLIFLAASVCAASPIVTCDPNDNIESPTDPNNVILTCTIEITKEEHKAMQRMRYRLPAVFRKSRFSRTLAAILEEARQSYFKDKTLAEIEKMK